MRDDGNMITRIRSLLERPLALWHRCDVVVRDLPLALLLLMVSLLPPLQGNGTTLGTLPDRPFDALAVGVIALQCLPLAVRRRYPSLTLALVATGFAADQLLGYHSQAGIAVFFAVLSAGVHLSHHRRLTAVAGLAALTALWFALRLRGSTEALSELVIFAVVLSFAWAVGAWLRTTRAGEVERRIREAELARAAERAELARELHDVVTHHVTAMVVQAEAAQYLKDAPDRLETTLDAIGETGRHAIADLRQMLGALAPEHDSASRDPAVGELHLLVERTRMAGQPIEFREAGEVQASPGHAEATLFRVVQEALTNAMKHAHERPTTVDIRREDAAITATIRTEGAVVARTPANGSGRGLNGLRERVEAQGGEFRVEADSDGFTVHARILTEQS